MIFIPHHYTPYFKKNKVFFEKNIFINKKFRYAKKINRFFSLFSQMGLIFIKFVV